MGKLEPPFELGSAMAMSLPADACLVANPQEIARLRLRGGDATEVLRLVALAPSEPIPAGLLQEASMMVIEVAPDDRASMARVAQIRAARPALPLIVALHDASAAAIRTLVRQGVDDVATMPFDMNELTGQLLDLAARVRDADTAQIPLAPLVSVVRTTGGCGATTVATHLAAELSRARRACLIDLDIQFGNVAAALGVTSKTMVLDLLEAGGRLDAEFLHSAAVDSGAGFDVIVAPDPITPLETVDVDQLLQLLTVARRNYGAVLVDLPANWTSWTLSSVLASTDIVLVTDLTIPGLRQAKRRLNLFDSVGVPRAAIRVVVNRVERRLFRTIGVDEVQQALGHPVFATLSADGNVLTSAQDQGLLAGQIHRKSAFAKDIAALADLIVTGWES